jgi:hypothetical protein
VTERPLRLPEPRFGRQTSAGPWSNPASSPPRGVPGGQPVPAEADVRLSETSDTSAVAIHHERGMPLPRWVRSPLDQRLHLLAPDQLALITTSGHGRAGCGRWVHSSALSWAGWSQGFLRAVPVHGGSGTVTEPLAAQDTQSRNRNVINWPPRCLPGAPHGTLRGALVGCGCLFCQAAKNAAVTPSPVPEGKATR